MSKRSYSFSPEEFSYLLVALGRVHSFMHTSRTEEELSSFQQENYPAIKKLYYSIVSGKLGDEDFEKISEHDASDVEFDVEVERNARLLS